MALVANDETKCRMKSPIVKRSIVLHGRKTSVSLELEFWECLREIAKAQGQPMQEMLGVIEEAKESGNLSSTLRVFVLSHYMQAPAQHDGPPT